MRRVCAGLILVAACVAPASGQGGAGPLFDSRDAWIASAYLGAAALAFPFDRAIAGEIQDSLLQARPALRRASQGFDLLGVPGAFLLSGGLYGAGRLLDRPGLADAGLHAAEAFVLAEVVTFVIKGIAGRTRPSGDVDDPFDFGLFRGLLGREWRAFPSGHASGAFAVAGALAHEMEHHWGGSPWLYGAVTYVPASLVGVSRLYGNEHWASDVIFGAAIGAFSGWKMVRYNHEDPDNRGNRWFLSGSMVQGEWGTLRIRILPGG